MKTVEAFLKSNILVVFILMYVLGAANNAHAEEDNEQVAYTYVADWTVAFPQWHAVNAYYADTLLPILERHFIDGTITGFKLWTTPFHDDDHDSHGYSWTASSIAGTQRVLEELLDIPYDTSRDQSTYHTHLFRVLISDSLAAGPIEGGYLSVSTYRVKRGKGREWLDLWERHIQPTYKGLLERGSINRYDIQMDEIYREETGTFAIVSVSPSVEGLDQIRAALAGLIEQRSSDERKAISSAFAEVLVPGAHRETYTRIIAYAHK